MSSTGIPEDEDYNPEDLLKCSESSDCSVICRTAKLLIFHKHDVHGIPFPPIIPLHVWERQRPWPYKGLSAQENFQEQPASVNIALSVDAKANLQQPQPTGSGSNKIPAVNQVQVNNYGIKRYAETQDCSEAESESDDEYGNSNSKSNRKDDDWTPYKRRNGGKKKKHANLKTNGFLSPNENEDNASPTGPSSFLITTAERTKKRRHSLENSTIQASTSDQTSSGELETHKKRIRRPPKSQFQGTTASFQFSTRKLVKSGGRGRGRARNSKSARKRKGSSRLLTTDEVGVTYLCGTCNLEVCFKLTKDGHMKWVQCDLCSVWTHINCLTKAQRKQLEKYPKDDWYCSLCSSRMAESEDQTPEMEVVIISSDEDIEMPILEIQQPFNSNNEPAEDSDVCNKCLYLDEDDGMVTCRVCTSKYHFACSGLRSPLPLNSYWTCRKCYKNITHIA